MWWPTEKLVICNRCDVCDVCPFLDEPNNNKIIGPSGEDCLSLMYGLNRLNDMHCSFKLQGYVCETDGKLENQCLMRVYGPI